MNKIKYFYCLTPLILVSGVYYYMLDDKPVEHNSEKNGSVVSIKLIESTGVSVNLNKLAQPHGTAPIAKIDEGVISDTDPDSREEGFQGHDLARKDRFERENELELQRQHLEVRKSVSPEELSASAELQKNMQDLFQAASAGEWESFLEAEEKLEYENQESLNFALSQALLHGAPYEVIEELISRGAQFNTQSMTFLAINNRVELTKKLIPLGLDIHAVDTNGKNGISHTLIGFQSKEMFDFLLYSQVSIKPSSNGFDPLDMALKSLIVNDVGLYYVEKLVKHGARIEASHKQLLSQINEHNPSIYLYLRNNLPEIFYGN